MISEITTSSSPLTIWRSVKMMETTKNQFGPPCHPFIFVIAFSKLQLFYVREQIMKTLFGIVVLIASFLASSQLCRAATDSFGIVKSVSGEVLISSPQSTIRAVPNMKVVQGNSIKTGAKSSVGLIFEDDTVVALGPNSEITIESYLFNPVDQELSFIARLAKGTFSFITGQIAKLAPQNVKFETPDATLGVRGTKLLVEID
jgi:hypothetical protein